MMNKYKNIFLFFIIALSIFNVLSVTSDEALSSYQDANEKIKELQSNGYPTLPLIDMLSDVETAFNYMNYNLSYDRSQDIFIEANKIIKLQENIVDLSNQIDFLDSYGYDTTEFEIKLLYTKSDYESANIDLAEKNSLEISNKIFLVSSNISSYLYQNLNNYSELLISNNESNILFNNYFSQQKINYHNKKYSIFLKEYPLFDDIKTLIELNKTIYSKLQIINKNNISFNRSSEFVNQLEFYLSEKDYESALNSIIQFDELITLALELNEEIKLVKIDLLRLSELGVIEDNINIKFNNSVKEFKLENFIDSKELLDEVKFDLIEIEKNNLLFNAINRATLKKGFKDFLLNNWLSLSLILLFIILTFKFFKNSYLMIYSKKLIFKFANETAVLITLQKNLQKEYYILKNIDKNDYTENFSDYEERKIQVSSKISYYKSKLKESTDYFDNLIIKIGKLFLSKQINYSSLCDFLNNKFDKFSLTKKLKVNIFCDKFKNKVDILKVDSQNNSEAK